MITFTHLDEYEDCIGRQEVSEVSSLTVIFGQVEEFWRRGLADDITDVI